MSSCCHDPTEPPRADPRDVLREQEYYIWSAIFSPATLKESCCDC